MNPLNVKNQRYCLFLIGAIALVLSSCDSLHRFLQGTTRAEPRILDVRSPETITETGTWRFEPQPDTYDQSALLDLRSLNEREAGERGFIRRSDDGRDFVKGDGTPIRFWAINSSVWERNPEHLTDHARFLAKRGVNMIRWHGQIQPKVETTAFESIDTQAREKLWKLVAAMKQEGIYVTISPYYAHATKKLANWPVPRDSDSLTGLLFFDPILQKAYRQWLRDLLEPINPYTGIALKDDPAVALIQLQNEDSLLFWTVQSIKGRDLEILQKNYAQWLTQTYGDLDQALQAWDRATIEGDQIDQGKLAFYSVWEMTQGVPSDSGKAKRLADQTAFWTETMYRFNAQTVQFLRDDLGAKQLINANNWRTVDMPRLNDAERYSYTATDVIAVNRYYPGGEHKGKNAGWAIEKGDRFSNLSVLTQPTAFSLNLKQVAGYPMIVSEGSWVPPLGYQSEGPFLISIFQSLTGIDGFYWFSAGEKQWQQPASANGFRPSIGKWVASTPELLGNFPAAALIYRKGYVEQGQPVVQEYRDLQDLWFRKPPTLWENPGFDPNRDSDAKPASDRHSNRVVNVFNPLAFLVGPVETTYSKNSPSNQSLDLTTYINDTIGMIRSTTQQIQWDYRSGLCRLDTPKAQGVTGFFRQSKAVQLSDVHITSGNEYATILVVSLDDQPIINSRKLLVQVGTIARPSGWTQRELTWQDERGQVKKGFEVIDYGQAPWLLVDNDVSIQIQNPFLRRGIVLDMNGLSRGNVQMEAGGGRVAFRMPEDAKYVILE